MIQFETLGVVDLRRDGAPVRVVLVQPRRLALLAYLAVARPRGYHSRDRLLALFWPDSDQERARNSLRQALHHLRRALGDNAFLARGDRDIALDPAVVRCDAAAFDEALEAGHLEGALNSYRGDFLPGFFLDSAPEAERFIEEERERYRRAAVGAAWRLVSGSEETGDLRAAAVHARRALALDPHDEQGLQRTLELLARTGERAAALKVYEEFARRLAQDLDLTPAQQTRDLVERLRRAGSAEPERPPVSVVATAAGAIPAAVPAPPVRPVSRRHRWIPAAGLVATAGLALTWALGTRGPAAPVAEDVSTIAVLPFVNITADPANEYLADGFSEELMAALARIPGLNVAGHTSAFVFKGRDVALDSIGRALRVGHVLEGSVRVTGNRVRIVAALVDTRSGYHAWSDSYDGELDDVLSMQDRISRAIIAALRPRFRMAAEPEAPREVDPEAHADLLRGRQAVRAGGPDDYSAARRFFTLALSREPDYAEAHAGMAGVHMVEAIRGLVPRDAGYALAVRSAERALALDPAESEAHTILGRVAQDYRWDFAAADRHFQRAIDLSPGSESWYRQRARLVSVLGRHDEAVALARRSTTLDPLAPGAHRYLGVMLYHARRHEEALQAFGRSLALAPDHPYGLSYTSYVLSEVGRHEDAVAATRRALEQAPEDPVVLSAAGVAHAAAGDSVEARRFLGRLRSLPEPSPYLAAEVLARLGDREPMFAMLDRAATERDPFVIEVATIPIFDPHRSDPRMGRLLSRMGLR